MFVSVLCVFVLLWIYKGRPITDGEFPDGATGEVIFSSWHGCQSLAVTTLYLKCCQHWNKTINIYILIVSVYVCIVLFANLYMAWHQRVMSESLSESHDLCVNESQVKTQSLSVAPVQYEGPLHGLFEQKMGELAQLVWNLSAFCLWQPCLNSSAWHYTRR